MKPNDPTACYSCANSKLIIKRPGRVFMIFHIRYLKKVFLILKKLAIKYYTKLEIKVMMMYRFALRPAQLKEISQLETKTILRSFKLK